jgi:hypothetical protein
MFWYLCSSLIKEISYFSHHNYGHTHCHHTNSDVTDSLVCGHRVADRVIVTEEASVDRLVKHVQQQQQDKAHWKQTSHNYHVNALRCTREVPGLNIYRLLQVLY